MEALKKVCNQCPFRKDATKGWLGKKRITEIVEETIEGDKYFVCHKTLDLPSSEQKLCDSSTRMGMAFGLIPKEYEEIQGSELIFESKDDCINHHIL